VTFKSVGPWLIALSLCGARAEALNLQAMPTQVNLGKNETGKQVTFGETICLENISDDDTSIVTVDVTNSDQLVTEGGDAPASFTLDPLGNPCKEITYTFTYPPFSGVINSVLKFEDAADPDDSAVVFIGADNDTGISDTIKLVTGGGVGPSPISPLHGLPGCVVPFCQISYEAQFEDNDQSGTTAVASSWTWRLVLQGTAGTYDAGLPAAGTNSPKMSFFDIDQPFTVPDRAWVRTAAGDISAQMQVSCLDSDGFAHNAFQSLGIKFHPNAPVLSIVGSQVGTAITLKYSAAGATRYEIFYGTTDAFDGTNANEGKSPIDVGAATTFTLTGFAGDRPELFRVQAFNTEGASASSNAVALDPASLTPTLSGVGEIAMGFLLVLAGALVLRRRRPAAAHL
jgi:hypothetical protein